MLAGARWGNIARFVCANALGVDGNIERAGRPRAGSAGSIHWLWLMQLGWHLWLRLGEVNPAHGRATAPNRSVAARDPHAIHFNATLYSSNAKRDVVVVFDHDSLSLEHLGSLGLLGFALVHL